MDAFRQNLNSPSRMHPTLSSALSQLTPAGDSSNDDLPPRRPTLLPAFEPLSSSPLPSKKRRFEDESRDLPYPTPVPTSSTGLLHASSPPKASIGNALGAIVRPALVRTVSTISERAPFSDISSVAIPEDGTQLLLGRSSKACHFQVPYNGLVSRVHVGVTYEAPSCLSGLTKIRRSSTPEGASGSLTGRVLIQCFGWNGCQVRYNGRVELVAKDDVFVVAEPVQEIMLDIMDWRVILTWPETELELKNPQKRSSLSRDNWADMSPTRRLGGGGVLRDGLNITSSPPLLLHPIIQSPISPSLSPAARKAARTLPSLGADIVEVYEDPTGDFNASPSKVASAPSIMNRFPDGSDNPSDSENENEENEPVVHTLGPYGSNILSRFNAIAATSPERPAKRLKIKDGKSYSSPGPKGRGSRAPSSSVLSSPGQDSIASIEPFQPPRLFHPPQKPRVKHPNESPIKNHVINQLAFSRIHSTPVSAILKALPADLKGPAFSTSKSAVLDTETESTDDKIEDEYSRPSQLARATLTQIIHSIPCIGEIPREGKDAAGEQLENEFYYVPDKDENVMRRETVTSGKGSTGLRSVRKQHKQYYWKRPRN